MNSNSSPNRAEALALARFSLISRVQELLAQQVPLKIALEKVASSSALTTPDGSSQPVAVRTLEDWWYAHQKGGFAALHPKARSDRGRSRKLTPELEQLLVAQVKAQPGIAIKVLYRQWKQQHPDLPSLWSLYTALRRHDLSQRARRYLLYQALSGPTKTFEVPLVNELWMVDFSPGPFLQLLEEALGELERRILVLILDEAQNYSQPSLEEVRLLLGLNLPEQPTFALVLIGDEYLLASLKLRNQRALYSRLACQVHLAPWTPAQCAQYLNVGLSAVGLSSAVLEPAATELLASASGGLPRSLCLLARAAWIAAATDKAQKILAAHVQTALEQVPCIPGLLPSGQSPEPA